ncbi:MAG: trypsin-like peptidase domain-containing protein, partial [bacterium]|nr:trypsin-like peptidase domain-containing protein [bacterium]
MRYIPYAIALSILIEAIFLMPPRTARYSFPRPPSEARRVQGEPQPVEEKIILPVVKPVKKKVVAEKIPPVVPVPAAPVTPSPIVSPPPPAPVVIAADDVPIDLRSVVVVKCLFKNIDGNTVTTYGSGVMVSREGYVLTARHVVDMAYTYRITGGRQGLKAYTFDSCRIAVPPDSTKTPSVVEIRTINPFTPVTEFAYNAQVALVPQEPREGGMSDAESDFADSALLRVTSAVTGALPPSFIASPMKIFELPAEGSEVTSFGFPSGVPSYGNNFYLQGSVGEIKDIVGGDRFFKDQPMGMTATMET